MTETELDRISRLLSGDLPAEEAAALSEQIAREPEMAQARDRLLALEAEARSLTAPPPSPARVEAWIRAGIGSSTAPGARRGRGGPTLGQLSPLAQRRLVGAGLAAAAVLVTFLALTGHPSTVATLTRPTGSVAVFRNGQAVGSGLSTPLQAGDQIVTAFGSTASIQLETAGSLEAGGRSEVQIENAGARLVAGEVLVKAQDARIVAGSIPVTVHGEARIRREPPGDLDRAMGTKEEPMHVSSIVKASTLAAGAGIVTVAVLVGRTEIVPGAAASPVQVQAPDVWSNGRSGATAVEHAETSSPAVAAVAPSGAAVKSDDLASWPREALAAEVRTLRARLALAEKRASAPEKGSPKDEKHPRYRDDKRTLQALAAEGKLDFRLPQLEDRPYNVADKVVSDLNLTPAEKQEIEDLFRESHDRIVDQLRKLYVEAGGDPNVADALNMSSLLDELRSKSAGDDWAEAVREIAAERAGLAQPPAQSSPVAKALRMLSNEDQKTFDDMDALLGPSRSQAYFENENTRHSHWGIGVGPATR